ncbi:MAG TPA: allene oxide cyclase family protein [Dongiaceae bacterium]
MMMKLAPMLAAVLLVASGSDGFAKNTTLKLVERATTDAVTDLGAKGDSAGDLLTFANPIYDEANAKEVGSDNGWCIRTAPGRAWECFWTLTLADGQITVEGPFLDAGDSVLAVTGGTGKYAGVRGEMKLHARDAKGSEYDFVYSLTD